MKKTIKDIKKEIEQYGADIPSGLKKAEYISYLNTVKNVYNNGLPLKITKNSSLAREHPLVQGANSKSSVIHPGFTPQDYLKEYGWVSIPIPDFDHEKISSDFLSWIEKSSSNRFKKNDQSTWKNKNLPPNLHGIFKHYIGHEEFLWETREKCYPIFKDL